MSETQPNPNTTRVEGELSLDDLSQIAGGTSNLLDSGAMSFGSDAQLTVNTDNMFTSFEGAKGSTDPAITGNQAMNLALTFP